MSETGAITLSMVDDGRASEVQLHRQPALIVALECSRPGALSARYALGGVTTVTLGRGRTRQSLRTGTPPNGELTVRIPDQRMSSRHALLQYSYGRWVVRDTDSKNGTVVNGEVKGRSVLADGDVFELGHTVFLFRESMPFAPNDPIDLDLAEASPTPAGLATLKPDLARELNKLAQVAMSEIPVLLQGESGTGKEVLARAVHTLSHRNGEFVAVNCGAIPKNLVESELFGHRRGAFSGAVEHREGLVRSADRGTLFLDEIGDLPAPSQAALLRVLQEREVLPVGASKPIAVDLRVVAATHRDLEALVTAGDFRRDLFARLAGFRMLLPALRQRRDDLGLLVGVLVDKLVRERQRRGAQVPPGLDIKAARALFRHDWPLNIRELEQALATALVLAGDNLIGLDHLPEIGHREEDSAAAELSPEDTQCRDALHAKLREHCGNVSAVARDMGKHRKQIQRWMKRFGFQADDFRT